MHGEPNVSQWVEKVQQYVYSEENSDARREAVSLEVVRDDEGLVLAVGPHS